MAADQMKVGVLHCDQGMSTLFKFYSKKKLTHIAVIDLGSESKNWRFGGDAIGQIVQALEEMIKDGSAPRIELLMISHQDKDHWSLIPDLLIHLNGDAKLAKTTLGRIAYGGTGWKPAATRCLRQIEKQFKIEAEKLQGEGYSGFADPFAPEYFEEIEGARFWILGVNAEISVKSKEDLELNGTSAVVAVEFGGNFTIVPGDATADTLKLINDTIKTCIGMKQPNPILPCVLMGIPHHGALRTLADDFTTSTTPKLKIATQFVKYSQPTTIAASAGYLSRFWHPYKRVMELFSSSIKHTSNKHTFVWYDDEESNERWVQSDETTDAVFTTITELGFAEESAEESAKRKRIEGAPVRLSWYWTFGASGEAWVALEDVRGPAHAVEEIRRRYSDRIPLRGPGGVPV